MSRDLRKKRGLLVLLGLSFQEVDEQSLVTVSKRESEGSWTRRSMAARRPSSMRMILAAVGAGNHDALLGIKKGRVAIDHESFPA